MSDFIFDIGGTRVRGGRPSTSTPDRVELTPDTSQEFIATLRGMYEAMKTDYGRPSRVRIACPGIVEGHRLIRSLYLPVEDVDIPEILGVSSATEVTLLNDVDAIALGDAGARRGDSYFVLSSGTAVGGAYVVKGKLQSAGGRSIAEIGHVPISPTSDSCACGGVGCLDTVLAGSRILAKAGTDWWSREPNENLAKVMFDAGVGLSRAARTISCLLGSDYLHLVGPIFSQPSLWKGFGHENRGLGSEIPLVHSLDSWALLANSTWTPSI